ncbi:MAG: 50S ribosomal protein L17 [Alphaproteobacteria bacterium RIFCSPLOWO2_01_FULL_45_8]|nr:MAG: 50S ribosomal protein L17 [Alphaproteobacteria bacterium GWB1_45_5]OFW76024.1 MAG: 50S ribosomal protein L17 [Alphaproteobacteria bacterium GWA1_45_9]OFW90064.1 MAG: 50S ribosomal protein L17 [Alphaproteobacteria bacterium RIFCSPHIGHO2_01_FULL_41_14]OFW96284.1 MAG: 50S ribosomal protein L17 [Alphaproteobacteria bacterium RIFCSPLOWO2_01_FULL_45_8]HCI48559.1 50S ribosomal protein L17 [Holosporales bacterium]
MRHKLSGRKLNRTSSHRRALFMNMSNSLFLHEQITTTLPKAKDLRSVVEKFITMAKNGSDSLHVRRVLMNRLNNNQEVVSKLLTTFADRYKSRAGGYTRVIKAGFRYGDSAPMAVIELVDRPRGAVAQAQDTVVIDQEVVAKKPAKKAAAPQKKATAQKGPAQKKHTAKKDKA